LLKQFWIIAGIILAGASFSQAAAPRFWMLTAFTYSGLSEAEIARAKTQEAGLIKYLLRDNQITAKQINDDWYLSPKRASLLLAPVVFKRKKTFSVVMDVVNMETSVIQTRLVWENLKGTALFNKMKKWIDKEDPVNDTPKSVDGFNDARFLGIVHQFRQQGLKDPFPGIIENVTRDMISFLVQDNRLKIIDKSHLKQIGKARKLCADGDYAGRMDGGKMIMGKKLLHIIGEQKLPFEYKVIKFKFTDTAKNKQLVELEHPVRHYMNPRTLAGSVYTVLQIRR
jgi:hypothetical protein